MHTLLTNTLAGLVVVLVPVVAWAQARFPEIPRAQMTEAQQRVYDAIASGPRGGSVASWSIELVAPYCAALSSPIGSKTLVNTCASIARCHRDLTRWPS